MRCARLAGHSIHPMLVVFPLGLLATAAVFDAVFLASGNRTLPLIAYWNIAAGIIGGLAAALFGILDWLAIPPGTRAKAVGAWHGVINVVVVAFFAVSWVLRGEASGYVPSGTALAFSFLGAALALVSGWLGGELVEQFGVGVYEGADLNAPSSLKRTAGGSSIAGARRSGRVAIR